ncbi:fumarylacetoacetate hydrolase family protein [Rubellimicrobium roseum]|uniref:Fumarylacetoacetate hydrolase family protein n=1 Tax=Rubellimicrobium roseum TaxID=687525 RepID=A0A5C4N8R2_9RHOB|nr:fumarylacetoacetate hydrolase family protein [Rubellimicrobium roseum]TNC70892.1 fumarylacetoacetate hydrolase family protein [Rubellimicrobium roseum]
MTPLFPPRPLPLLPILGQPEGYPVARIFCVGRNYAAHAAEMGNEVDREAPFWFTKSPFGLIPSGAALPYPPGTRDLHHEVELVVALGEGGQPWGVACGLDMTRRDLQARAKEGRKPWDTSKDWEGSAVVGPLRPGAALGDAAIRLWVNGALRQDARLSDMVWDLSSLLRHLGGLYRLGPGDLLMTGTPAGVGAVEPGDRLRGEVDGLPPVELTIGPPD